MHNPARRKLLRGILLKIPGARQEHSALGKPPLEFRGEFEAVHIRQDHVKYGGMRPELLGQAERFSRTVRRARLVPSVPQIAHNEVGEGAVIIHYQHTYTISEFMGAGHTELTIYDGALA